MGRRGGVAAARSGGVTLFTLETVVRGISRLDSARMFGGWNGSH